jgi:hypothetical protein
LKCVLGVFGFGGIYVDLAVFLNFVGILWNENHHFGREQIKP